MSTMLEHGLDLNSPLKIVKCSLENARMNLRKENLRE